jgi:putative transposase
MARPLRIQYPGALYHVISRGDVRQEIFLDIQDRKSFLKNLEHCIKVHNIICHAYCLMDNHYHLLIETPEPNLSSAMRDINGNYTQKFNFRHGRVGHVFQGRYKSFLIEKELYLLEVARYIVLNPVRAKIVQSAHDWRWSSYGATTGRSNSPNWLHVDWILNFFGEGKKDAQNQFRKFVEKGLDEKDPHEEKQNGYLLGSQQFVDWVWRVHANESENVIEHPREQRIVGRPDLKDLFMEVKTREERDAAILCARLRCGYPATEIAKHVGLHPSVVSRIIKGTYNKKSQ